MKFNGTKSVNIYVALLYRMAILMLIYSFLRLGFYIVNQDLFLNVTSSSLLYMMLGGLKFDISALLYINSLFIVLQCIPFQIRYKKRYQLFCKWLFIVSNSIGIATNIADFAYYKFTLKRTTGAVFEQFSNEENLLKLTFNFLVGYWYLLFLFAVIIFFLNWLYTRIKLKPLSSFTIKHYLSHTLVLGIIGVLVLVGMRGGWRHSTRPITLSNAGEFVESPEEMSIVLNTPFSIFRTLGSVALKPKNDFSEDELNSIYNPVHLPKSDSTFKNLNVVFLIIESLGKEYIGALNKDLSDGNYKGYTPFIDSLVENSYTFTNSYANGRKSIDALPAVITSIPSVKRPFILSIYSGNETSSIAKLLSDKGYETAFFHGAPNGSMGFSSYTKLAGIQHYFGKTEYNNDADFDGIWGIWDEPFMQFMAQKINTLKEPFFSSFFSLSSHHPFKVPKQYEAVFPKGPLEIHEPVGYTDMAIRKFFETASKMPWYNNTLFVLVADHASMSYFPEYKTTPGAFSIPILFYYPGGNLKGHSDKLIQQLDIAPTVLNYLNFDKPYFSFGFDAFDEEQDNFVVNNNGDSFNFYQGNYLLVYDEEKSIALYNVKTDRLTEHNLLSTLPAIQQNMEKHLKAFIQQYNNRMIENKLIY